MSAYFWILSLSFFGPFILSFDKKIAYYKSYLAVFVAIFTVSVPFILWDIYFTSKGIWGFTPEYLSGIYVYSLPLEECLFFIIIPFACLFIHQVLKAYFPLYKGVKLSHYFAFFFVLSGFVFGILKIDNWYTSSACVLTSLLTIWIYFIRKLSWYRNFVFTYLVALIPFLIVNGILTGAFSEKPIVWYNENHIIGFRIYTIPLEDLYYNYDLLLPVVAIFEFLKKRLSVL